MLLARLLPVVRTFIALPAGIAKMPRLRFHIYTFVGSWPWCFVLAYVGMRLGERWETDPRLKMWFHRFDVVIAAGIVGCDRVVCVVALEKPGARSGRVCAESFPK